MSTSIILLILGSCIIRSVVGASDDEVTQDYVYSAYQNSVHIQEMLTFPINAHPLILGYYETIQFDIQMQIRHFYLYGTNMKVTKSEMHELEKPIVQAVTGWIENRSNENLSKENLSKLSQVLNRAVEKCNISVWESAIQDIPQESVEHRAIGDIYTDCSYQPDPLTSLERIKDGLVEKYIWEIDEDIRKALPMNLCGRVIILGNIFLHHSWSRFYWIYLDQYHSSLKNAIYEYLNETVSTEEFETKMYEIFKAVRSVLHTIYKQLQNVKSVKEQASEMIYVENVLNSDSMKKKMIEYPEKVSSVIKVTWHTLMRMLLFPDITDPAILGNLEMLPETVLDCIRDIYDTCAKENVRINRFKIIQSTIATAVIKWKYDHVAFTLFNIINYLNIYNRLIKEDSQDESNPIPTYSKIEKTINCKFEDNTEFPDIHATEIQKKSLSEISEITYSKLPTESCIRIAILRNIVRNFNSDDIKTSWEKQILRALQDYVDNKNNPRLRVILVQIHFNLLIYFEKPYYDKITTAKNVGQSGIVGSSISLSPEQIHIIDTSATQPTISQKEYRKNQGESSSSSGGSEKWFTYDILMDEIINKTKFPDAINTESKIQEFRSPTTLLLPPTALVYSNILIMAIHLKPELQESMVTFFTCIASKKYPPYLVTFTQKIVSDAIQQFRNGSSFHILEDTIIKEMNRCFQFISADLPDISGEKKRIILPSGFESFRKS